MKWFRNMKIKMKMLVSFSVVITLLAALSVFSVQQMATVDGEHTYSSEYPGSRQKAILEFQSASRDLRRIVATMTMYIPLNDISRITPLVDDAASAYNTCIQALAAYESYTVRDPMLSQAEKDVLIEETGILRDHINSYNTEIRTVVESSALRGEYEPAILAVIHGADIIGEMRGATIDMLQSAVTSAREADADATVTAKQATVLIIIVSVVAAVLSFLIAIYVAGLISKPLVLLSSFMKKAGATGDLTRTAGDFECISKHAGYHDELGNAIAGSASFISHVTNIAHELESVANGDLTVNIDILSELDTLGVSLKKMSDSLNGMFGEIQVSAGQVSEGSRQIAEGSQSLAQGSTEQAASIQQLSSSIAEIAEKTKTNAATADKTSKLSTTIKESAEKGSRQMDEMIAAVNEINNASMSISKIIKTIDALAFQTNILALNAAVEAARAGQHGKGFAVVADEVRNLASKSAEAARDTGSIIQNSMSKAELGSRIAEDTAASLKEIVSGINESSVLIAEIAAASGEQSKNISQVNSGIELVAHVVQQNSATSQESAAAAQQMNGLSLKLLELVDQFKLEEDADSIARLQLESHASTESHAPSYAMGPAAADAYSDFGKYSKPYVLPHSSLRELKKTS